ncbi:MAG TPA: hypothetical protein VLG11_04595 [Candidatus Saccharimonadales bacterium]|nr:hypothetical protein [Candidatus Saccharimonadales bacterium]
MNPDYWLRQAADKPLFPELEWSRPENRMHAGKLLIVGGNAHGFAAPAEAYNESFRAGIGAARVLLPDAIKKDVGQVLEHVDFAPSTPSGSFSQKALGELCEFVKWADGILLAGDLGRNSETAIWLERFLSRGESPTIITKDAADYISTAPGSVLGRPNTTLAISLSQLQRLATAAHAPQPVRFNMNLLQLVDWLHDFTSMHAPNIIVKHLENIFVAVDGQVSTTRLLEDMPIWRVKTAAHAAVWWIQNLMRPFEGLTTAVYTIAK